jgi:hypothetical protein
VDNGYYQVEEIKDICYEYGYKNPQQNLPTKSSNIQKNFISQPCGIKMHRMSSMATMESNHKSIIKT